MAHKQEILNVRDRYVIGNWVLKDGQPYRWTADDYNRSQKGMECITPMPLTKEMMFANGFRSNGCKGTLVHETERNLHVYYKIDHFEGSDWIVKQWEVVGICGIETASDFQNYLTLVGKYDMAEGFKLN